MANPQKENGSTDIANELLEQIYAYGFTAMQLDIILCVIRYTYGFHRKVHSLSISFIANATKHSKSRVGKEIKNLIDRNILISKSSYTNNKSRKMGVNKKYKTWDSKTAGVDLEDYSKTEILSGPRGHSGVDVEDHSGVDLQDTKKLKSKLKIETKEKYGTFSNVFLEKKEYESLAEKFTDFEVKIDTLSEYMKSTGKTYKDHYATILNWARRDASKNESGGKRYTPRRKLN